MKVQIEIEDNLNEILARIQERIKELLIDYLDANPNIKINDIPDFHGELNDDGSINEIIDNAVPIGKKEIKDIWYLHGDDIETAFELAGVGEKNDEGWPSRWKPAAIYSFLESKTYQWYDKNYKEIAINHKKQQAKKKIKTIVKEKINDDKYNIN